MLVSVQHRQFICTCCGTCSEYLIYPDESAMRIECRICAKAFYWSRKKEMLYDADTQQPAPPENSILLATKEANQL